MSEVDTSFFVLLSMVLSLYSKEAKREDRSVSARIWIIGSYASAILALVVLVARMLGAK